MELMLHELLVCVRATIFDPQIRILLIVTNLPVTFGKIVSLSQQLVLRVDTYNCVGSVKCKRKCSEIGALCVGGQLKSALLA